MKKLTLESTATIRFQDCDPMGHLNNGKYINLMLNAREDQVKLAYDLDIYDIMKSEGKAWVVAKSEILYKRPANLMEKVRIRTQMIDSSSKHIKIELVMTDINNTHIKALLYVTFVHIDLQTKRSTVHSHWLQDLIDEVTAPILESPIESRLAALIDEVKLKFDEVDV